MTNAPFSAEADERGASCVCKATKGRLEVDVDCTARRGALPGEVLRNSVPPKGEGGIFPGLVSIHTAGQKLNQRRTHLYRHSRRHGEVQRNISTVQLRRASTIGCGCCRNPLAEDCSKGQHADSVEQQCVTSCALERVSIHTLPPIARVNVYNLYYGIII